MKIVYLLHFISVDGRPYKQADHAGHYIGFCEKGLPSRLQYHRSGHGSRLMKAVVESGHDFVVALVVPGDRHKERTLKNYKGGNRLCPLCRGDALILRHPRTGRWYVRFKPGRRSFYFGSY